MKLLKNNIKRKATNPVILFFARLFNLYFLPSLLIFYLFLFSISNYSETTIILKTISFPLLLIYWNEFKSDILPLFLSRFLKYALLIIVYFLITVYYSVNPQFGLTKLYIMLISYIPLIALAYIVFKPDQRRDIFINLLIVLACIGSVLAIIISPFAYETAYSFSFFRWSHVVFSRFIGLAILFNLYLMLGSEKRGMGQRAGEDRVKAQRQIKEFFRVFSYHHPKRRELILNFSFIVLLLGLLFSGARGAIVCTFICIIISLLFYRSIFLEKLKIVFLIGAALILFYTFTSSSSHTRLLQTAQLALGSGESDGSLNSRVLAFEISIERWGQNPIFGLGLGGFNTFYKTDLPRKILYPHNIFLETLVELGILGTLLILTYIVSLFTALYKIKPELIILFLYALGLAMFSKDMASNPLLFSFIAIYFGFIIIESQN